MAKYEVLEKSFIGDKLVLPGETVDYDGEPGPNLKAVDKAAAKAAAATLPNAVAVLVGALRMHAVARGVTADEVTAVDFAEYLAIVDPRPDVETINAAATALNVDLGQKTA